MLNSHAEQAQTLQQIVDSRTLAELENSLKALKAFAAVQPSNPDLQTAIAVLIGAVSLKQQRSLTQMSLF